MRNLGLICVGCSRAPEEISEYVIEGRMNRMTPEEFVLAEEGTLNPFNGHFMCTECYFKAGMPSAPGGWKAP